MSAGSSDRTMIGDWWLDVFTSKPAHLRFVLEMARYANDKTGEVRVSLATIAKRMGTTERRAFDYCKAAKDAGILKKLRNHGRGQAAVYQLNYSKRAHDGQGYVNQSPSTADMTTVDRDTTLTLSTDVADPAHGGAVTLLTSVQKNGTRNGSMNGSIDRTDFSISPSTTDGDEPADLRRELMAVLERFKPEHECEREARILIRQVGVENVPLLIDWLKSDLSWANNPIAAAIKSTMSLLPAPSVTKPAHRALKLFSREDLDGDHSMSERVPIQAVDAERCVNCGRMRPGESKRNRGHWCFDCIESAQREHCPNYAPCPRPHYPWEPCEASLARDSLARVRGFAV